MATKKATDFKVRQKVTFKTQRGNAGTGVIQSVETPGGNGKFYHVKDGDKVVKLRASQLQAA